MSMYNNSEVYNTVPSNDEKLMGMLIYLLSFFTAIVGPLIIWILKKDESEFINYHGKEYFNFMISMAIYGIISTILILVLIGILLLSVIGIVTIIFTIIGAVKAYNGERWKIPFIIRFIK